MKDQIKDSIAAEGRAVAVTFQGQTVTAGTILFSFSFSDYIKVITLTDCGAPNICAAFEYEGAEYIREISPDFFCTVPSQPEVSRENKELEHNLLTNNLREIISLYTGDASKAPLRKDLLAEGGKNAVARFCSLRPDAMASAFAISNIYNGGGSTKTTLPIKAVLNVFFRDRRDGFRKDIDQVASRIKTGKAVEFLLKAEYFRTFQVIDGINQQPDGLNFGQWLIDNKLV